ASIRINSWPESDSVLYLQDTSGSRSGTLNIDLEAGAFYVVSVQQSLYSFVWDDISIQVVISLAEAG
ncbi:MAG: hypothetical protein JW910_10330, partial [Anaerolineae bacterium]|nr:hypothetical protein [Anaerolineae bacterium]